MDFMYFFLVIGLLGSSIVYGFFIFFLSFFVSACQPVNPVNNDSNFFDVTPLINPVIPKNLTLIDNKNQQKYDQHAIQLMTTDSNNLHKILTNTTQSTQSVSSQWQSISQRYASLPPIIQQHIAQFYSEKSYAPVWIMNNGEINQNAVQVTNMVNQEIYLTTPIVGDFLKKISHSSDIKILSPDSILQKDLEFTIDLFFALEKIRNGMTIATPYQKELGISDNNNYKTFDFKTSLINFSSGNVASEIATITNMHEQYPLLKQQVNFLNNLQHKGGYIRIPQGNILKLGMTDKNIILIRKRLMQSGFITSKTTSSYYDTDLQNQVMAFQTSRGIKPDGVIGFEMYQALNRTVNKDLSVILANIERIRRSQNVTSTQKHVYVNVPEMALYVKKGRQDLLSMKTIVGRKDRKTPIFNDFIEYVDINPYWNVPYSLATKDILPKLKNNPSYLTRQNIKIFRDGHIINPRNINWRRYSEKNFPFTLRQEPSKNNALGTVKFMFPNTYAVYLHDTPAKGIFYQYARSESSGCIRVSKPKELAILLLQDVASEIKVNQIFALNKNKALYVAEPIPISIEYLTAFVRDGVLNMRPDIYDYDTPLVSALIQSVKDKNNMVAYQEHHQ